jgi:hypothetical protein
MPNAIATAAKTMLMTDIRYKLMISFFELAECGIHHSPAYVYFWRSANKEHENKLSSWN